MARLSKHSKNFKGLGRVNRSMQLCLIMFLVFISRGFGANVTLTTDDEYVTSEDESDPSSYPSIKIYPKALFGALKWKLTSTDLYMARCNIEEDCDAGIRMICVSGKCICKPGDLFFEWPKYGCFSKDFFLAHMFGPCEVSGQCVAMNPNTYCNPDSGRCTCSPNYFYNGRECSIRYDGNNMKAQEVYKAAVVAAACFIVAVVGIFVACIVRRSFCRRDQHLHQNDPNPSPDVFSISDEIAALRAVDKPPSYEEVLQIERTFYGIPPPEYSASRSALVPFHPPTNYASTPASCHNLPPSEPHNSSSSRDYLKASYQESAPAYSRDPPVLQDTATNFLADVEVLPPPDVGTNPQASAPPPSDLETSNLTSAQLSDQTSNVEQTFASEPRPSTLSHYISSTPPPRLHRLHIASMSSSSSLPSSPNLSSGSSHFRVLNLPNPFRKDLLKNSVQLSEPNSPSHVRENSEVSSISCTLDVQSLDVGRREVENNHSELAYDNLGFVSDLHV